MIVYYAEVTTPYGVEEYLGVFTESAKAEASCQDHSQKHYGQRVAFTGFGDRLEGVTSTGRCYTITALEVDREIWR